MNFTVTIPTEIVDRLRGVDISRRALEAFAIEEFRIGNLTQAELCRTLGFATRGALDVFLKDRGIYSDLDMQDLHEERRDLDRFGFRRRRTSSPTQGRSIISFSSRRSTSCRPSSRRCRSAERSMEN